MFSSDALLAVTLFVIVLLASAWAGRQVQERITLATQRDALALEAKLVASQLAVSPGLPADWDGLAVANASSIQALGLGSWVGEYLALDPVKVSRLAALMNENYTTSRALLGVYQHDLRVLVKIWNGTDYGVTQSMGLQAGNATQVSVAMREMVLDAGAGLRRGQLWVYIS
ncbi:hypothetical protein COY28_00975, partial [Candidatus Woesearchaeota archaeon CG_4_10_14_0_2_um_filter_57_5]